MSDQSDLCLNVGEHRIFISRIKVKDTRKVREKMTEIKAKHSPYNKVPRKPEETGEQWTERYLEYIGETNVRGKDEDLESYKLRVLSPTSLEDDLEYMFDILKGIAELFAQGEKVTKDSFEEVDTDEALGFIIKVLKKAKYPTAEFESSR